jgi:hypothetical protein
MRTAGALHRGDLLRERDGRALLGAERLWAWLFLCQRILQLMPLSQQAKIAIIGVVGTLGAYFVFGGGFHHAAPTDPADAVPKESFLVATVDAQELRKSPLYTTFAGKDGSPATRALGVGALADACGFDPLSRVVRLAVAVPEDGDRGDIGLAARVEVSREELERCTRSLAEKRGEKAEPRDVGAFSVIEGPSGARLAYGSGLLVVGKGAWHDAMMAAAEHKKPGLRDAREHTALRESLTQKEGWRAPTILATALLPKSLRERLKRDMGSEVDAEDPSANVMSGVLGVSSVGVAIKAGGPGGNIDVAVEMQCDSSDACATVEKLIQRKRLEWSKDLMLRLAGFGQAIDSLEVKHDGTHLRATVSSGVDSFAAAIDRAIKHNSAPGGGGPRPKPRPEERIAPPTPDETLKNDAGSRPRP